MSCSGLKYSRDILTIKIIKIEKKKQMILYNNYNKNIL